MGILVLLLANGAVGVFVVLGPSLPDPTPTETLIPSPVPTSTIEPPIEYVIKAGDTCGGIAVAFNVSTLSIITLNNLSSQCTDLVIGQALKIPCPTAVLGGESRITG